MGGKSDNEVAYQPNNEPQFDFASMMGAMGEMSVPSGPSAESIQADADARAEEDRVTKGLNDRDALYSEYLDAGGAATDYINNQINSERSNANLLGIEYNIDDATKQGRIDNYFASIWGEGAQGDLENLFTEFGNPEGFEAFQFNRGDSSAADAGPGDPAEEASAGQALRPTGTITTSLLEEEEPATSILGGG